MDAVNDPLIKDIVVMSSAQVGKTELLLNTIGYHIGHDPAPILLVQPTKENAEAFSKDRLAPMLRDTPVLKGKVADARSRDSNNTITHKTFAGGHITMVGANSPVGLASRPIRIVLCDETDRYPLSSGGEGDPVDLARKRATTFWNRKVILVSTPVTKGASIIEEAYQASDQRRFYVPCPDCGHEQILTWAGVHWPENEPESAEYCCEACGVLWSDADRNKAVKAGKWIAERPDIPVAGFWINAIYSPWVELGSLAKDFLRAKENPGKLQTFVNTVLAETWEEVGTRLDANKIRDRLEAVHSAEIDDRIIAITAGADIQKDRIEVEIVGWAADSQSWSLDYHVIMGDPAGPAPWEDLEDILSDVYTTQSGTELRIRVAAIDSGYLTSEVYHFTRNVVNAHAVKGVPGSGRPIANKASMTKDGTRLTLVGVDAVKDLFFARAEMSEPGPGYMHFPEGRDDEYFKQLLESEEVTTTRHRGQYAKAYKQIRARNEALDCRVYAIAALHIARIDLERLGKRITQRSARERQQSEIPVPEPRSKQNINRIMRPGRQRHANWATDWRNG